MEEMIKIEVKSIIDPKLHHVYKVDNIWNFGKKEKLEIEDYIGRMLEICHYDEPIRTLRDEDEFIKVFLLDDIMINGWE